MTLLQLDAGDAFMTDVPKRIDRIGWNALIALMCAWQFGMPPVCAAAVPDEDELGRPETLRSTLRGDLGPRQLDILDVHLGTDTIATVREKLGPAKTFSLGGLDLVAICYAVPNPEQDLAVVYQSSANDAARVITVALVGPRSGLRGSARHCAPASEVAKLGNGIGGLKPGMTREQLRAMFEERPSEDTPRYLGYFFYLPVTASDPASRSGSGSCQLLSGLRARFAGAALRSFATYRIFSPRGC